MDSRCSGKITCRVCSISGKTGSSVPPPLVYSVKMEIFSKNSSFNLRYFLNNERITEFKSSVACSYKQDMKTVCLLFQSSSLTLPVPVPMDGVWTGLPALAGSCLRQRRENVSQLLFHATGELQVTGVARRAILSLTFNLIFQPTLCTLIFNLIVQIMFANIYLNSPAKILFLKI